MQQSAIDGTAMSRKDDLDNHANQLNPNNDAYYSSRYGSGRGDDDDDYAGASVRRHYYSPPAPRPVYTVSEEAQFTAVALNGQMCLGRVLISDTSTWNDRLHAKVEDKALSLHQQFCEGLKRLSGCPVVYAKLTIGRSTVDEMRPWEPLLPAGWSKHWERVDRKQWKRLERTRSYRQQAMEARQLVDHAAAQVERELLRQSGTQTGARARALSAAAQAFRGFAKAPVFRVHALWTSALERARAMDATALVREVTAGISELEHALRTVDVLVRASNARAPESLRHPASFGYGMPDSDSYEDYFGGSACKARLGELDVWFNKGERRLRALLSALKAGRPRARYDFGTYDITMQPDFHIPRSTVERAMALTTRKGLTA